MTRVQTFAAVLLALSLVVAPAVAQRRRDEVDPMKAARWDKNVKTAWPTAQEADIKRLDEGKVLITNEAYKQIFSAYMGGSRPLFITSDSLLNAYHVLYEESILRLEKANARKLAEILQFVWKYLPAAGKEYRGRPELVAAARRRAQVVIGTALRLLGDATIKPTREVGALIDAEVKRVEAATGQVKPKWLGPPDDTLIALDYTRYKPRGFYTRSDRLKRYFRAVSWLQSIPFRLSSDEELVSMLMLAGCLDYDNFPKGNFLKEHEYRGFLRGYARFIGAGDDWDMTTLQNKASNYKRLNLDPRAKHGLTRLREGLKKEAMGYGKGPQINDQLRFAPEDPSQTAEPHFRVLSARRTPDAILFGRTTDLRIFKRPFPSGLEVCAALGSTYARSKLTGEEREKLLQTIDACKGHFEGSGLYVRYLHCLAALIDKPEPDAPAFMSGDAWQTKSCQTVLAGWAQLRHTWALQAKQTVHYAGMTRQPAGFVEPEPEFFRRMAWLTAETELLLKEAGAFATDRTGLAHDLKQAAALLKTIDFSASPPKGFDKLTRAEQMLIEKSGMVLMALGGGADVKDRKKAMDAAIVKLDRLATDLANGKTPDNPMVVRMLKETDIDVAALWRKLHEVCRQLEALAHKQLRGVPFTDEENGFIKGYGETLAGIMFYGGNAYLTPNDDAPRVIDVFSNPNTRQVLEVGVARARAIYVLYPHDGAEVLCKGAVMPYYEFRHARRLTDAEWKQLLDSADRPDVPAWLKPIIASGGLKVPDMEED